MLDMIVLAGSNKETELTKSEKATNKAFIEINGRPMLSFILDALSGLGDSGRIAVVGPAAQLTPYIEKYGIIAVPEAGSIVDNIQKGFRVLQPRRHFLIVSADVPFLTTEAAEDFLQLCKPYDFDFYYPIVARSDNEKRFPGVKRTYVKLADGEFTGGNLFLVNPARLEDSLPRLQKIFALRKSPVRLAATLGLVFVFKLVTRRLTLAELEKRFSALFALQGKALVSKYPEIGTDVDKPSDLILARRELL